MKAELIDLHTHSIYSDGSSTPGELIQAAKQEGARAISLTDHDTIDGLKVARSAAEETGMEFIDGVEISAEFASGTMHILGYFIDPECEFLTARLRFLRTARERRNPQIASRLRELGLDVCYEEVVGVAGGEVVGRPHFARVLVEKGYVGSIQEAFDRYLAKGAAAYVEKVRPSPGEAIELIHRAGGVAVLAHPYQLRCRTAGETEAVLDDLAALGLDGVEAIYSRHSDKDRKLYAEMARDRGLAISGGSDFHGSYKPDLSVVIGRGDLRVPYSLLEELKERANARRAATAD
jgi:predicted metal-dependent phosphoesterase TrpH